MPLFEFQSPLYNRWTFITQMTLQADFQGMASSANNLVPRPLTNIWACVEFAGTLTGNLCRYGCMTRGRGEVNQNQRLGGAKRGCEQAGFQV